jgi:hypothetical protein
MDVSRRHIYRCPAGCRGAEADGSFACGECPACGSDGTVTLHRTGAMEEFSCNSCGTISGVYGVSSRRLNRIS